MFIWGRVKMADFFFYISNRIIIITINIIVIIFIGLTAKLGVAVKSEIA